MARERKNLISSLGVPHLLLTLASHIRLTSFEDLFDIPRFDIFTAGSLQIGPEKMAGGPGFSKFVLED